MSNQQVCRNPYCLLSVDPQKESSIGKDQEGNDVIYLCAQCMRSFRKIGDVNHQEGE
jgi:hypothetical protein